MNKADLKSIRASLMKSGVVDEEKIEALMHALVDVKESFEKIYKVILPQLVKGKNTREQIQDLVWDIREEFRHIEYHIRDSDVLDL